MLARNQRGAGASDTLTDAALVAGFAPVFRFSGRLSVVANHGTPAARSADASAIGNRQLFF
jgi:hypothetical protein